MANEEYIIKQEQGKVYYYQNKFNLLFDFDAKVNDTVKFIFKYKKHDSGNFPLYTDTLLSARYQIESITTNVQGLKTFTAKILEEDRISDYEMEILPWRYSYTEKMGFHQEFIPVLDNLGHTTMDNYPILRCYSDADISFVSNEWANTIILLQ